MRRSYRIPEPANPLDPEIAQAMVTSRLQVPPDDVFEAQFSEEDLVKFKEADQKLLGLMSIQRQWIDWLISAVQKQDDSIRQVDAEVARRKIDLAKLKSETEEQTIVWRILRWMIPLLVGGALTAIGSLLIKGGL